MIRPSPQAVWQLTDESQWLKVDAEYCRFPGGDGTWKVHKKFPENCVISISGLKFAIELTDFGHLGIFPEQEKNWTWIQERIESYSGRFPERPFKVLNLFAYTGGSTLAAAKAGAQVVHVDASKTSVAWARKNAAYNGLQERHIRWIIDDVRKFVAREVRRGNKYQAIILDPPSFGRGPTGESWKIEEHLVELFNDIGKIAAEDLNFIMLSSHSNGYTPLAMKNLLQSVVGDLQGEFLTEEMIIPEKGRPRCLPSGASCLFVREELS
jgi:23S rRNA (cytosine1962-C5)-methyltransferase